MRCDGDLARHSEDIPETLVPYIGSRLIKNGMSDENRALFNRSLYARFAIFDSIFSTETYGVNNFSPYQPSDYMLFQPEVRP